MRSVRSLLLKQNCLVAVLIGLLYFAVQISFIGDYGVTWDEPLHRNWGKLFSLFWQTGDFAAIEMMPGKGMYYGPLYYFVNYLLSEWLFQNGWMKFVAANHVLNLFTASIGVGLVYLLGRAVSGWSFEAMTGSHARNGRLAGCAVVFFVFFPQLIAHAHYNPKDIPLMVALLATSIVFLHALKTSSRRLLLISAFLFGMAFALKVSALLMAPVFLATYLLWLWGQGGLLQRLRRDWLTLVAAAALFFLGAYLFWPSAWMHPRLIVESFSLFTGADFWPGKVLFFGQEYGGADLPWFYTTLEFLMAMPLLLIVFFLVGVWSMLRKISRGEDVVASVFLLLWIFFPLLLSMKPGLVRYDGIRQFFFMLPAVCVVSAFGFDRLLTILREKLKWRAAAPLFIVLVLISLSREVVLLHPFEGSYRNEVVRMLIPENMDRTLEIEYWGASYKQGIDWLMTNAEPNPVICVPTAGILVTWYPWRKDFTFECTSESDYIMFFTRYSEAGEHKLRTEEPVFRMRRMNADLLKIYKI